MKKIKFAIVGIGNIGRRHVAVIDAEENAELVTICDTNEQKCKQQSELYDDVAYYTEYDKMLSETDADIISICTPHAQHCDMTVKAAKNNFHVLVEKPMALNIADADKMINTAQDNNVQLFVVKQNRFNVPVKLAKQAIDQNKLGQIYMVQCNVLWNRNVEYYADSDWRGDKAEEGGALFTQVSHFIDLMVWMFGDVTKAQTNIKTMKHQIDVEDSGISNIEFESGTLGSILWTTNVYNKNYEGSITIIGEKGTIKIGGAYLNQIDFWDVESYPLPNNINFADLPNNYGKYQGTSSNHDKVIKEVVKKLNKEDSSTVDGEEGKKSISAIELIYNNA